VAATNEDLPKAIRELKAGLALPQEIPALAADMRRLCERLEQSALEMAATVSPAISPVSPASIFLTGYGREA
jgi:hypothetical protein